MPMQQVPDKWYKEIEGAKNKGRLLLKKVVGVNQSTSIVVGKLVEVDIDKMGPMHFPSCKLIVTNAKRFSLESGFKYSTEDMSMFFVNRPDMIFTMEELKVRFPDIYEEVLINVKKGVWDGP